MGSKSNLQKINLDSLSIPELEKLIEEARKAIKRQQRKSIRDIKKQFAQMAGGIGMTPEEVIDYNKKKNRTTVPGEPKYRNPDPPHQTWTGHGKRPKWFLDALEKYTEEEMLIKS